MREAAGRYIREHHLGLVAIFVAVGALALFGCGGGSDNNGGNDGSAGNAAGSDSENEGFIDRVNGYCADFAELARLGDQTQDSSDLQAAARATAQYAQKGEQVANNLSKLSPPAGTEHEWNRFVDAIRATARTAGDIITSLQNQDVQQLQQLEPELRLDQDEFVAAGRALGDAGIRPDCLGG
jgi:hypothetical protein